MQDLLGRLARGDRGGVSLGEEVVSGNPPPIAATGAWPLILIVCPLIILGHGRN